MCSLSCAHVFVPQPFRGKQWKIERDLVNKRAIVHVGEDIKCPEKGYEIKIQSLKSLTLNGKVVSCGLITKKTKFLFRSRSAWCIYLVQLSKEMWDFSGNLDNGKQIHFEKFIDGFLKTVMSKWEKNGCHHLYSIIFFSRTFYDQEEDTDNGLMSSTVASSAPNSSRDTTPFLFGTPSGGILSTKAGSRRPRHINIFRRDEG